jgi:hypothetical protein
MSAPRPTSNPGSLFTNSSYTKSIFVFSFSSSSLRMASEMKLFLEAGYREYFVGVAARPVIKIWTMRINYRLWKRNGGNCLNCKISVAAVSESARCSAKKKICSFRGVIHGSTGWNPNGSYQQKKNKLEGSLKKYKEILLSCDRTP